jgi:hypothetical protein
LGHFFASAGQPHTPRELIDTKGYVPAVLIGTLCSFLISYLITSLTPFLLIFLLMMLYFAIAGFWILDTGWPEHCAGYIFIALLIGNLGSEILAIKAVTTVTLNTVQANTILETPPLTKGFKGRPFSELIHIVAENRRNYAMFEDGKRHRVSYTIRKLMIMLPPDTHLRVNRGEIVKLSHIEKARYYGPERTRIRLHIKGNSNLIVLTSIKYTNKALKDVLRPYLAVDY